MGGLALVGVAGGTVWRAWDRGVFDSGEGPAFEPWTDWRGVTGVSGTGDARMALVANAILAASPHNTQPWIFRAMPDRLDLHADLERNLGALDPFLRELYLGLGCAAENLSIAAAALGVSSELTVLPDPADHTLAVSLSLGEGSPSRLSPDEVRTLFEAIPSRRTDRGVYDRERSVDAETLEGLRRLAEMEEGVHLQWITDQEEMGRFGDLVVEATEAIIADPDQAAVTPRWLRLSPEEIDRRRDGLTLDAQDMGPLMTALAKIAPPPSPEKADAHWLSATRKRHLPTARAFAVLSVGDQGDRAAQVRCGRAWQRVHLAGTGQGLALQPLNQLPERDAREQALGLEPRFGPAMEEWTGPGTDPRALLCFRVGYPRSRRAVHSPRRPISDVLTEVGA